MVEWIVNREGVVVEGFADSVEEAKETARIYVGVCDGVVYYYVDGNVCEVDEKSIFTKHLWVSKIYDDDSLNDMYGGSERGM